MYERISDIQSINNAETNMPPSQCCLLLGLSTYHSPCKLWAYTSKLQQPELILLPCLLHGQDMSSLGWESKALTSLDEYPLSEKNYLINGLFTSYPFAEVDFV